MTQLALVFLGSFASLTTLGLFVAQFDAATRALTGFIGAVSWGLFGISSFDVIVTEHVDPPVSEPILPLAYLGIGLAIVVGLFATKELLAALRSETEPASPSGLG